MARNSALLLTLLCAAPLALLSQQAASMAPAPGGFTLEQVMGSPFPSSLTASSRGEHIAWTADLRGVRNVFVAEGPDFQPRQVTHYTLDDGQPIAAVRISPDGHTVVYARGSEHNSLGNTADPDSSVSKPEQDVWSVRDGGTPRLLGEMGCNEEDCEDIAMSPDGQWVVWPARNTLWIAPTSGTAEAKPLTWAMGDNVQPQWSPDSRQVAFVSLRVGHSLIAIYTLGQPYLRYLAPSVDRSSYPRWSPDGRQIVFIRERSLHTNAAPVGVPEEPAPPATMAPNPPVKLPHWELWVGDVDTLRAHAFWQSGSQPQDALYSTTIGDSLQVGADHRVLFSSEMDGWNHLYSVSDLGAGLNPPVALTPGEFEVKDVALAPDGRSAIFASNQNDVDRRHLWRVGLAGGQPPVALSQGETIEWSPVITRDGKQIVCLGSSATSPAMPYVLTASGRRMIGALPADWPGDKLVAPRQVIFPSTDGLQIHGQLFEPRGAASPRPTLIFVHGGSRRQMMLGFHIMDYYHNAYSENEYLVSLGFNVLSVNYRTGIMYGRAFRMAPHTGRQGGKEYDDVVAAAKYLATLPEVDAHKLGIWGGSYGGYLTAMALSHNSDLFAAGVDFHGVHDWSTIYSGGGMPPAQRPGGGAELGRTGFFQRPPRPANQPGPGLPGNLGFDSSPDAWVENWRSPVLLIQGDDDRNVDFSQMIDLVARLRAQQVPFEQMVLPDEIHGFLRWISWVRSYAATADFFQRVLQQGQTISTNN